MRKAGPVDAAGGPAREHYHHGDLTNALTCIATALAREMGPDAVVMREVARLAGVSPAAAYRHFDSHGDLLRAVRDQARQELLRAVECASAGERRGDDPAEDAIGRLVDGAVAYVEFAVSQPGLFRAACLRAAGVAAADDDGFSGRIGNLLGEPLDTLITCGTLPSHRRQNAWLGIWTCVHGLADLAPTLPGLGDSRRATIEFIVRSLTR